MPLYQYVALDAQGLNQQGSIEAEDARAAAQTLRARALFVVRLDAADEDKSTANGEDIWTALAERLPVRNQHLILFFKQMGMMLRNGLTLLQALDTASTTNSSRRLTNVIHTLRENIGGGASFSDAMAHQPRCFSHLLVQLVRGAEASGELDTIMERIAVDLERKADLQRQLITSLTYPLIVLVTSIGVAIFLVVIVVPQFAKFFAKSGRKLPPVTQSLLDFANFVQTWGLAIGCLLAAGVVGLIIAWRRPHMRLILDRWLLRVPVIGHLVQTGNMARFAWSAALLVRSGVTLLETLRVTSAIIGNTAMAADVRHAANAVLSGRDLASSLQRPTIPLLVPRLAAVGERTGALEAVLQEIGDYYLKLLEIAMKRLTALVEPVLILFVGGMVGYVYYAFFQALFAAAG